MVKTNTLIGLGILAGGLLIAPTILNSDGASKSDAGAVGGSNIILPIKKSSQDASGGSAPTIIVEAEKGFSDVSAPLTTNAPTSKKVNNSGGGGSFQSIPPENIPSGSFGQSTPSGTKIITPKKQSTAPNFQPKPTGNFTPKPFTVSPPKKSNPIKRFIERFF